MNFKDFFKDDLILLDKKFFSKKEALTSLAKIMVEKGYASSYFKVVDLAMKREAESSTGIGENIAIPHIRDNVMKKSVIFFAKVKDINWKSLDGQPVKYIFFIALNPSASGSHVEILAELMKLLMKPEFKKGLENVKSIPELISLMEKHAKSGDKNNVQNSTKKVSPFSKSSSTSTLNVDKSQKYDVVAVTACPTGIAHTFMARDMLEKAAAEMGISIKVETQGADGVKNVLSQDDISNAKGVIIACDRVVDLSKFSGHPNVLEMGTKPVIKDAKKEIQKILDGKGHKFAGKAKSGESSSADGEAEMSFNKFGKRAYKSLLTGVSYMLPFVIFGGILIAIAFLIDMKNAGTSDFGSGNVVSKWIKELGSLAFGLMVPILAAYIAFAIVGRQGLLPGFVVGLIAKGDFFFSLDPKTGSVQWLVKPGQVIGWDIAKDAAQTAPGASSGVFGAIAGAFLAATVLILLSKLFTIKTSKDKPWFPDSLNGIKNILILPLFGTFITALSFWIINIPLIYLNWGFSEFLGLFNNKPYIAWLLGLIIAAMMSIDLGGPINKAAYVFATATLLKDGQAQSTIAMAASMAGGMTAPLGIALSCSFFKKLWTKEEREAGLVNYVMGLSFISEGAIPFTVKNPKVMMPSNIIGSAVCGIIIGALNVTIGAPHGGLLTIALAKCGYISNYAVSVAFGVIFFIVAIAVGSITTMFCIYFFTKFFNKKNSSNNNNLETKSKENNFVQKESRMNFSRKSIVFQKQILILSY